MGLWKSGYNFLGLILLVSMFMEGINLYLVAILSVYFLIWLYVGGYNTLYIVYHTFGRDFR